MKKKRSDPIPAAFEAPRHAVRLAVGTGFINKPRILPIPKIGGALPALLIPIKAALGAAGSVTGGAAGRAKAAPRALEESERHNKTMEAIAIGK